MPPEDLARIIDHTALARRIFGDYPFSYLSSSAARVVPWENGGGLALERRRRSSLIVRLAAELYRREKGELPATAGVLVGPHLKELPEGIAAGDPIPKVED